jgi:hypothetical protein
MEREIMEERAEKLVSRHLEKYPQMRIADVYKLLYQACMGAEHALSDRESLEKWLSQEWDSIEANENECLYDDLSLHHPIYRINLRAAKVKDITSPQILDEFIRLGNEFPRNPEVLTNSWDLILRKFKAGKIELPDVDDIDEFDELVRKNQFPPMHHSMEYSEEYLPAYRLLGVKL